MIPPKRLLTCFVEHWGTIEKLLLHFSHRSFSLQDVQNILKALNPDWRGDKVYKELQRLIQLELIIPMARSSQYELNRAVHEFSQYLLKEHELGLADEINVLVEDIIHVSDRLATAAQDNDKYDVQRYCWRMDDRVRQVIKQFQQNENAIHGLAERAKYDLQLSLSHRYQAVMEAFDEYIEPMLDMVNIHGPFQQSFDQVEARITAILDQIQKMGQLQSEKEQLIQLRTRILDMYAIGQNSLRKSADILLPLREELRKNTRLARKASAVLSMARKKGVDQTLLGKMPGMSSDFQRHTLGTASQMAAFMAELESFESEEYQLPEPDKEVVFLSPNAPKYKNIRSAALKSARQMPNLLSWLNTSYPTLETDELLYLYQKLANDDEIVAEHAKEKQTIQMQDVSLTLYPMEACEVTDEHH